ncbi:unnamed protein product [Orchesella dallaii]|uniref:DNA2/NAM7 helicase helicase domain-containing protein n=1 Tax=Orchesella dallaii TaxID=48710 RepID=A0ABP1PSV3_9HEXA
MGDTTYPGVMLTRVNPNITEDQVIDYVSSRIGSSPTLYTNGQPEVTIYNAPKASGEEQVVRALVNGILLPFDEIRRRFGSCLMQGQQVFIQTPDMGVPRKVDGDFTTEGKFLHNHIVEGQGSFAALPLLKHGIDKKLENVTALQHTLLYNDTKQSVHINNLYNAGSVIVYGNTNRGHRSLNEGFSRMEIVFNTRMDALQAICKLNLNPTFSKKGKTNAFLLNENCRPCTLKLDVGLGLDGSILDITRLLTRKKYIPLEILNSEIFAIDGLRKKTYYCFDCKSSYIILGVGPNLDWLAATCTCPTYQSEYTWNEELFFRIRCWPQNEQNPVVRITRGLVPLYRDVMEFKNTALAAFLNESNLQKKTLELSQALGKIVAQEVVELKPSGSVTHVMQMLRVQVPETKVWSSEGSKSFKKAKLFYTEENALSVCVNKSIVYEINSVPSSEHPLSEVTLVAELLPHNNVFRTDDKILIVPQQMENAQQAFLNALRTWSNYDHMLKQPNDYLPATLESYSTCKDFTTKLPITRGDRFHDCFTWLFEIKTANSPTWNLLAKLLDSCYVGVNINVKINGGRSRNYPARIIGTYECGPNEIILETILFLNFNKISNITSTCSYNVWIISKAVKGVPGQLASLANNNVDFGTSTALVPSRVAVFEDENIDVGSTSDLSSVINVWRQRPNRNLPLLDLLMQPRKTAFYPTPSPTTQVPSASHCHDIQMLLKSLNDSQHAAVVGFFNNLLTMTQGPPGTGKTTTIATGILSLVGLSKGIVVGCCQSNYATNVLLEAISKKNKKYSKCPKTIVRMQSFTQQNLMTKLENQTSKLADDEYQLHLLVRNHPKWKANFEIEKILAKQKLLGEALLTSEERTTLSELADEITTEILASADIILCTVSCASDGRIIAALRQAHLIGRHFLGMVVDKASLLTVPSVLPILILNPHRLWLVGDDCQLSPTVSNEASRLACLDVSWFEFLRLT